MNALLALLPCLLAQRGAFAVGGSVLGCLAILVAIACFIFWVWMLIDCIQRDFGEGSEKVIWVLVIVFLGIIGAIIYYFIGRPKGTKTL